MAVGNVSFGRVIAVTGNLKKTNKLNMKMQPQLKRDEVLMYDVTHKYQFSSSSGALGKAVHNGERAIIYVTGNDVLRVKSKEKGWESIDSILYHMSDYINLNKESIGKAINRIV